MTDQRSTDRPTGSIAPRAGHQRPGISLPVSLRRSARPEAGSTSVEIAGLTAMGGTVVVGAVVALVEFMGPLLDPVLAVFGAVLEQGTL